jgi:cysteine desulfurase
MIYLDHNATTPLDPEVLEAMRPFFLEAGNAQSQHAPGRRARRAWEESRETVARILGANPSEVVFTSGGTEANTLAVVGLADLEHGVGHLISSPIEHPAVAEPIARLESVGFLVDRPPVSSQGIATPQLMADRISDQTRFVTLMLANNETGAIQPVEQLARLTAGSGVSVHTDAVQAVGRIPVNFHSLGVATLAASAHKFHGPIGAGILLVRQGVKISPWPLGGVQHSGRRPGTIPVPLVIGLAAALNRWHSASEMRFARWVKLRDRLEIGLISALGPQRVIRNGPHDPLLRLPQTLNLGFVDLDGDALLMQLDLAGVAASLGAACASGSRRASPTLVAMQVPDNRIRSSIRFSFGAETTEEEIDEAIARIVDIVEGGDAARGTQDELGISRP